MNEKKSSRFVEKFHDLERKLARVHRQKMTKVKTKERDSPKHIEYPKVPNNSPCDPEKQSREEISDSFSEDADKKK